MYKHLMTAVALIGLSLVGAPVRAEPQDQQAQQHMRACLGVVADAAAQEAQRGEGVPVREVNPNGPAAKAGLQRGDVITRVGRRVIEDFPDLANAITRHQPGERVTIQARRDGQERTLTITLGERTARWMPGADDDRDGRFGRQEGQDRYGRFQGDSAELNRDLQRLARQVQRLEALLQDQAGFARDRQGQYGSLRRTAFLGVQTRASEANRRRGGMAEEGVQVAEVDPDSPAAEAGLRSGDVITAVNGRDVATPQELRQAVQRAGAGQDIALRALRGDRLLSLRARLDGRSAGADDTQAVQRLARRMQQLEERIEAQADFTRDRQDRYGRWQGTGAERYGDVQGIQRRLQQMESRLRELEQEQQGGRPQGL